jgi:hypothetical protein
MESFVQEVIDETKKGSDVGNNVITVATGVWTMKDKDKSKDGKR